jgi:hypothetical protein
MSGIDILSLDQVSAADTPFEFEVKDAAGQPMGLFLSILGNDADRVQKFTRRKVNEDRRNQLLRMKKGKLDEFTPIESDIEYSIEACLVRTVGWRGAKQSFSADLARTLFERNRFIRDQVLEESANAANFLQRKAKRSSSSPNESSD